MDSCRPLLLLLTIFLFTSCLHHRPKPVVSQAYYFWRTNDVSYAERKFLKAHGVQKLYVHLLDIDWSNVYGAVPVADNDPTRMNYEFAAYDSFPVRFVPVVFITAKTFERIDSFDIRLLAKRVVRRCLPAYDAADIAYENRKGYGSYGSTVRPTEIQFDCDWTQKTAHKYFVFLREVKSLLPSDSIKLSATIRLHQFKYPGKTGVPPVSRGMLMVYNVSDPKQYSQANSIFEKEKAAAYFTSAKKYPLPLDVALPAWSWCIVYRDKKFYQVENALAEEDLQKAAFLKPMGAHFYRVMQDTVYRDLYLRPGDELKAEGSDSTMLAYAASLAQKAVNTDSMTVALFELSQKEFSRYSYESIQKVYASFR